MALSSRNTKATAVIRLPFSALPHDAVFCPWGVRNRDRVVTSILIPGFHPDAVSVGSEVICPDMSIGTVRWIQTKIERSSMQPSERKALKAIKQFRLFTRVWIER